MENKRNIISNAQVIKKIVRHLNDVVSISDYDNRIYEAQKLVLEIKFQFRYQQNDHLFQTTAIWVLINIFRINPSWARTMMIECGIPSVLCEVLRNDSLAGASKAYASELCRFLW